MPHQPRKTDEEKNKYKHTTETNCIIIVSLNSLNRTCYLLGLFNFEIPCWWRSGLAETEKRSLINKKQGCYVTIAK